MLMAANSLHITKGILTAAAGGALAATTTAATAGEAATEISIAAGRQDSEQPLRCPRCDSSNTKFCYYNNYSLSQPRHFCKACKRYWTRGGTLRNVPVGGGCHKKKRARKPKSSSSSSTSAAKATSTSADPSLVPSLSSHANLTPITLTASSSALGRPLYGHSTDVIRQAFLNPSISYDLQSQFSTLGLFAPNADEDYLRGLRTDLADHLNLLQTAPAAAETGSLNSLDLHDYSILGSNPFASLHASSLMQQQPHRNAGRNPNLSLYAAGGSSVLFNDVQVERGCEETASGGSNQYRFDWQVPSCENAVEKVAVESSLYWSAAADAPAFGGGALL